MINVEPWDLQGVRRVCVAAPRLPCWDAVVPDLEQRSAVEPSARGSEPSDLRWMLHCAGIVNVYQYGDETLHFGGGRLLRGVNGSEKSTAMNMLLPFLLDADTRRIDAAGEQSRVLQAWMLSGRERRSRRDICGSSSPGGMRTSASAAASGQPARRIA